MVKKQVPDWLNSSLWSTAPPPPPSPTPQVPSPPQPSPPPDDDVYNRPTRSSSAATSTDFPVDSFVPVAPPAVTKPPEPMKAEIRDPLCGSDSVSDHEYNGSSTSSSVEDISRQAQLLQEAAAEHKLPCLYLLDSIVKNIDCCRRLGPRLLGRVDDSGRLVRDFYKVLNEVNSEKIPDDL